LGIPWLFQDSIRFQDSLDYFLKTQLGNKAVGEVVKGWLILITILLELPGFLGKPYLEPDQGIFQFNHYFGQTLFWEAGRIEGR